MPRNAVHSFAAWLTGRCEFLHNLEAEAERVLQEDKDTDKYTALMRQKAMFLQALPEEAAKADITITSGYDFDARIAGEDTW